MLDLDGTTIPNHRDGMPSQKVIDAVKKAHKKLAVCIATGRSLSQAEPILDILQITNPVILLGGSQITDGASRKRIYIRPMEQKDITAVFAQLTQYNIRIYVDEKDNQIVYTPSYKGMPFNILAVHLTENLADELIDKLSHIPTIAAHKIVDWTHGLFSLNIAHVYATKQHAIFEVARRLNIETHEIIGVGDGPNDFPLLMACGLKVAMGNAVEDLKAIADYIAPTVDEDGVADVIERFVLK